MWALQYFIAGNGNGHPMLHPRRWIYMSKIVQQDFQWICLVRCSLRVAGVKRANHWILQIESIQVTVSSHVWTLITSQPLRYWLLGLICININHQSKWVTLNDPTTKIWLNMKQLSGSKALSRCIQCAHLIILPALGRSQGHPASPRPREDMCDIFVALYCIIYYPLLSDVFLSLDSWILPLLGVWPFGLWRLKFNQSK